MPVLYTEYFLTPRAWGRSFPKHTPAGFDRFLPPSKHLSCLWGKLYFQAIAQYSGTKAQGAEDDHPYGTRDLFNGTVDLLQYRAAGLQSRYRLPAELVINPQNRSFGHCLNILLTKCKQTKSYLFSNVNKYVQCSDTEFNSKLLMGMYQHCGAVHSLESHVPP